MEVEKKDYKNANVGIFPIPYALNSLSGQREGPRAIIESSRWIELYDIETQKDLSKEGIFTLQPLDCLDISPQKMVSETRKVTTKLLDDGKFPLLLGGEHTISLGAAEAFKDKPFDFSVLQIDAHTDLSNDYDGVKYHKGCVMRRIHDLNIPITQVGIRSTTEEEVKFIKAKNINTFYYRGKLSVDKIISTLKKKVYLTIDLDALDSSIMPATGTPEPGGLTWYEILNLIKTVSQERKIIGADIVELDPIPELVAPDLLAAKLVYKIISYII